MKHLTSAEVRQMFLDFFKRKRTCCRAERVISAA